MTSILIPEGPSPAGRFDAANPTPLISNFPAGYKLVSFYVQLSHQGGIVQHQFQQMENDSATPPFASPMINNAVSGTKNTPALSNVVGFGTAGAGYVAASPYDFAFDCANDQGDFLLVDCHTVNWAGLTTPGLYVRAFPVVRNDNINGVTMKRMCARIYNHVTGALFDLTTMLDGDNFFLFVNGFMK